MKNKKRISIKKEYRIFYFNDKYGHMSFVKEFTNIKEANEYANKIHLDLVGIEEERRGF